MAEWAWAPDLDNDVATKGLMLFIATSVTAVGCLVAGLFLDNTRALLVLAFMLASIAWFGRSTTRRLRTLQVTVADGIVTLADSRNTTTIDLRTAETLDVRSRGDYMGSRRWAVEAVAGGRAIEHRIGSIEQYWSLPDDQIERLRQGLQHYHAWYRGQAAPAGATAQATAQPIAEPVAGPTAATGTAPFEWRIPRHPNADRNRKRVAWISGAIAAALTIAGIVASWPDALGILLSIVVFPGMAGVLGGGVWWAYTPVKRFRLTVADSVMQVHGALGSKQPKAIQLAGATDVVVDTTTSHVTTANGSQRTTFTYIRVEHPSVETPERITLPSGPGSALRAEDRILLEQQLRQLAGLGAR